VLPELPLPPSPPVERRAFDEARVAAKIPEPHTVVLQDSGFDVQPSAKRQTPPAIGVQTAGFGESRIGAAARAVPSTGLGYAGFSVTSDHAAPTQTMKTIAESGFAAQASLQPGPRTNPKPQPITSEPVQILQKPRPAYTAEARLAQIEGEVVIEAVFTAEGEVRVIRVVRGLGHGLDENAIAAARAICFAPARRDRRPIDMNGIVRITFQLAY
jgi:TonB family protein